MPPEVFERLEVRQYGSALLRTILRFHGRQLDLNQIYRLLKEFTFRCKDTFRPMDETDYSEINFLP
jgi:hypothetical protein